VAWVTVIIVNWVVVTFAIGVFIGHALTRPAAASGEPSATEATDRP